MRQIVELCEENGLQKPDFIESGMFLQLRFYRKELSHHVTAVREGFESVQKQDIKAGHKSRTQKQDAKAGWL